jgi:Lon protease-like protein
MARPRSRRCWRRRDLKSRAETLIAITEIALARGGADPDTTLQ